MTIKNGRMGIYGGKKRFFTLRDPKTGMVWSDDIKDIDMIERRIVWGKWVSSEKVSFI